MHSNRGALLRVGFRTVSIFREVKIDPEAGGAALDRYTAVDNVGTVPTRYLRRGRSRASPKALAKR